MLISEECLYGSVFLKECAKCEEYVRSAYFCFFWHLELYLDIKLMLNIYFVTDWMKKWMNDGYYLKESIYNLFIFSIYRPFISFVKNDLAKLLTNNWLATVFWKSEHREFWAKKTYGQATKCQLRNHTP